MNTGTTDEVKGKLHEVKGTVKEKVGQVTNNPDVEAEGKAEHNCGKVQKKVGQSKKCSKSKLGGVVRSMFLRSDHALARPLAGAVDVRDGNTNCLSFAFSWNTCPAQANPSPTVVLACLRLAVLRQGRS